jgi:hypothetical protein
MAPADFERPDEYVMTCAMWTAVHGITSLRIAFGTLPWPSVDDQLAMVVDPWREVICPVAGTPSPPTPHHR